MDSSVRIVSNLVESAITVLQRQRTTKSSQALQSC